MATAAEPEFTNHSEILQRFVAMRDGVEALWSKINELRNEVSEHEQVLKALEAMEGSRRCYRLIGDVLVERTVEEVIPAIKQNEQNLETVLKKLGEQLETDQANLAEFQKKYKIRVKGEGTDGEEKKQGSGESSSQGVLLQYGVEIVSETDGKTVMVTIEVLSNDGILANERVAPEID